MRWWVEVTALDGHGTAAELTVEARGGAEALEQVRRARNESGALSLEQLTFGEGNPGARRTGLRAIDVRRGQRYLVSPAPLEEVWTTLGEPETQREPMPSHRVVVARDHDPTPALPLVYRERGVRVDGGVGPEAAARLLGDLLEEQLALLAGFPPGKMIELAAFSGALDPADLPPPLVTLSYKDWRGEAELTFAGAPRPTRRLPVDSERRGVVSGS